LGEGTEDITPIVRPKQFFARSFRVRHHPEHVPVEIAYPRDIPPSPVRVRFYHRNLGSSDVDYDTARIGYGVGHVAGRNPDYRTRSFDDVEADLRRGWSDKDRDYDSMRPFVREGYERSSRLRDD
jgi:hypothetical protein